MAALAALSRGGRQMASESGGGSLVETLRGNMEVVFPLMAKDGFGGPSSRVEALSSIIYVMYKVCVCVCVRVLYMCSLVCVVCENWKRDGDEKEW